MLDIAMDREQKIERIKNLNEKVSEVGNLRVTPTSLDSDYQSEHCDGVLGKTGYLQVLKIVRKDGANPYFVARWDQKDEALDIDIVGASNSASKRFKAGTYGYSGHHTNRSTDPGTRIFDITIRMPKGLIFDGTASFSVTYQVRTDLKSESLAAVGGTIIRANGTREDF
jgi:hypothetical protein